MSMMKRIVSLANLRTGSSGFATAGSESGITRAYGVNARFRRPLCEDFAARLVRRGGDRGGGGGGASDSPFAGGGAGERIHQARDGRRDTFLVEGLRERY